MLRRFFLFILTLFPLNLHAALSGGTFTVEPETGDYVLPCKPGLAFDEAGVDVSGSLASLVQTPAATVRSLGTTGQTTTFSMDGGFSRNSRVALDGAVIDIGGNPVVDLGILPLEFCQSASVYRDNLVPYGLNASSGLLDFRTANPLRARTKLSISGGSFGYVSGLGQAAWNMGGIRFLAGASLSRADNGYAYVESGVTNTASNLDYFRYSGILRMTAGDLSISASHTGRRSGTGTYYAGIGRQADEMTLLSLAAAGRFASFESSYVRWSNRYSNDAILVNDRHVNHTLTLSAASVISGATNADGRRASIAMRLASRTYAAVSTQYGSPWDEQASLSADGVLPAGIIDFGAAANLLWSAASRLYAIPSLSATAYFGERLRFLASASRIVGLPSFNDLYWQFDGYSEGNPALTAETGWKFKAGVMLLSLPFYGTVTAAYTTIDDQIMWLPQNGVWKPVNIGRSVSTTADAAVHYETFARGLRIRASAGFSCNRAVNADPDSPYFGKRLLYSPLYKTSINASVGAPDVWEVSIAFRQVSERFVTELNTVWLDPYYLLDVKVCWKFLFVSAANLLDADYEESQGYPMPGRTFAGGVEFEF